MGELVKILFIGDIIGRPGRNAVRELLPGLVGRYETDMVIANGENAAGGFGITPEIADDLFALQIDVITSGNHIWDKKEIYDYFGAGKAGRAGGGDGRGRAAGSDAPDRLLRPANYPDGAPGRGYGVFECPSGAKVGVVNLSGRVFMGDLDCPFRSAREAVDELKRATPVVVVDMHAETTSEKAAMGWFLDGSASAVIGTHTHVQTSDERVLAGGTAYITDAGMTGPMDSVIGMKKDAVIERFITRMPSRFEVAARGVELQGVFVGIDASTGRAQSIERVKSAL